jgi:co-chaperonin GroES (HSP10)
MRAYKLILKEVKEVNYFGEVDKDAIKTGKVAFPFKGEVDGEQVTFKKGDEVGYQYGNICKIDGEEYLLVSLTNIVWQK